MKSFMKKLYCVTFALLICCGLSFAQDTVKHTVDKGETLSSIAKLYGVTESKIIKLNPDAAQFIYVGMELIIPASEKPAQDSRAKSNVLMSNVKPAENYNVVDNGTTYDSMDERNPELFSHWYISYFADPSHFDKGFYGLGWVTYGKNGFGGTFSVHGNFGIVDPGNLWFKFGPAYGYAVSPNLMVNASLRGFLYTYDELNGTNETSTDQKVNGGITLTPGITIRAGKFMIDAGFEFGWENDNNELYKAIELTIGYNF